MKQKSISEAHRQKGCSGCAAVFFILFLFTGFWFLSNLLEGDMTLFEWVVPPFLLPGFLIAALFTYQAWKNKRNAPPGRGSSIQRKRASEFSAMPRAAVSGDTPVILKAGSSRVIGLIVLCIFTFLWNGGVSIFLMVAFGGFGGGGPGLIFILFLIPFVLIGLGLIAGVIYGFLKLFNPEVTLLISTATPPLGRSVELSWTLSGRVQRIQSFVISLVGREEATYRRGTDTHTDRNEFLKLPLVRETDTAAIARGETLFAVPEGSMHTLDAANNKVKWSLKVEGDIPKWPDLSREFPITVLPIPREEDHA